MHRLIRFEAAHEFDQAPHPYPRWPFRDEWLSLVYPGGAGDVEVDPGLIVDKLFQEHSSGDSAAVTASAVYNVGYARLNQAAIFIVERTPPHFFAGLM